MQVIYMTNYQLILDEIINENVSLGKRPTLLLHACCAPCSSYVLEYLSKYFEITVFYYNPNISSLEEYEKRKEEIKRFIDECNFSSDIKFVEGLYDNDKYEEVIKGLENEKEGGSRCKKCYYLRLEESAKYASDNNFDYFSTTLSISPYKNAQALNEIGKELSDKFGISYLFSDFKKKNGYKRSIELSSIFKLYRQDYCGCIYSQKR
ncbi:MAG: epoxyqueuosine reductase QueH [Bacilli bacterium]|nr:epoxyqueuosine reductase QueH [Bacilli bacterium]